MDNYSKYKKYKLKYLKLKNQMGGEGDKEEVATLERKPGFVEIPKPILERKPGFVEIPVEEVKPKLERQRVL